MGWNVHNYGWKAVSKPDLVEIANERHAIIEPWPRLGTAATEAGSWLASSR